MISQSKIKNASMITIPETGINQYNVIASSGPRNATESMGFWRELVLDSGVKLICCLANDEHSIYWPLEPGAMVEQSDNGICVRVSLQNKT